VTRANDAGFISLGRCESAIVEVIALKPTTLFVLCSFVGVVNESCSKVIAGNSISYRPTFPTSLCFFATDVGAQFFASGEIENSTMQIFGVSPSGPYNSSNPLPEKGISAEPFMIVFLNSPDADRELAIEFSGRPSPYNFQSVDIETGRRIVGVDGVKDLEPLVGEPDYPPLENSDRDLVMGLAIGVIILAMAVSGGFANVAYRKMEGAFESSDTPQGPLYDQQEVVSEETAANAEGDEHVDDAGDHPREENPYDDSAPLDL
jgi:hypothetical protein